MSSLSGVFEFALLPSSPRPSCTRQAVRVGSTFSVWDKETRPRQLSARGPMAILVICPRSPVCRWQLCFNTSFGDFGHGRKSVALLAVASSSLSTFRSESRDFFGWCSSLIRVHVLIQDQQYSFSTSSARRVGVVMSSGVPRV